MTEVTRTKRTDVSADELWARIGDFQDANWHPVVAATEGSNGGKVRVLRLADGGEIRESLVGEGKRSYTYSIDESPLPLADYEATISVREADGGSEINWQASFRAEGASEEEAAKVVGGMFDAGLGVL